MKFERTADEVKEFVIINHHLMTIKEMAEEVGRSANTIFQLCQSLGIVAISEADRRKDYIKAHTHLTANEIGKQLGSTTYYIKQVAAQIGIILKTEEEKHQEEKAKRKNIVNEAPISLWPAEAIEYVNELTGYNVPGKKKIKRISEPYTQTGSQFTDELRGIKTTERIK